MSFMSDMIELSEKAGQIAFSNGSHLPKLSNPHDNEVRKVIDILLQYPIDGSQEDKDTYYRHVKNIIAKYTKARYEQLGITIIGDTDDLFYSVALPDGWRVELDGESSYWSYLYNDKNERVASMFYKAAFYDERAFINFEQQQWSDSNDTW